MKNFNFEGIMICVEVTERENEIDRLLDGAQKTLQRLQSSNDS